MTNEELHKIIDANVDDAVLRIHERERGLIRAAAWSAVVTILNRKEKETSPKPSQRKGVKGK